MMVNKGSWWWTNVKNHVNDFRDIPWFIISLKLGISGESKTSWQKHALLKYDFGWSEPWHFCLPLYLAFGILSDILPDILSGMLTCILSGILSASWHLLWHFSVPCWGSGAPFLPVWQLPQSEWFYRVSATTFIGHLGKYRVWPSIAIDCFLHCYVYA